MTDTYRALVINPGESFATVRQLRHGDLQTLQGIVGGWLEGLPLAAGVMALINEEGKLQGLARNHYANDIASALMATAGLSLQGGDYLAGPVVFVGEPKRGETTDVPKFLLEAVADSGLEIREGE